MSAGKKHPDAKHANVAPYAQVVQNDTIDILAEGKTHLLLSEHDRLFAAYSVAALRQTLVSTAPRSLSNASADLHRPVNRAELQHASSALGAVTASWNALTPAQLIDRWKSASVAAQNILQAPDDHEYRPDGGAQGFDVAAAMAREHEERERASRWPTFGPNPKMQKYGSAFIHRSLSSLGSPFSLLTEKGARCDVPGCAESPGVICRCRSVSGDRLCFCCDSARHAMFPCNRRSTLVVREGLDLPIVRALRPNEFVELDTTLLATSLPNIRCAVNCVGHMGRILLRGWLSMTTLGLQRERVNLTSVIFRRSLQRFLLLCAGHQKTNVPDAKAHTASLLSGMAASYRQQQCMIKHVRLLTMGRT